MRSARVIELGPRSCGRLLAQPEEQGVIALTISERFHGKVALITGAAQGIGQAVAERLAAEGATVVVTDLDGERASAVAQEITGAAGLSLDVTDDASIAEALDAVRSEHGGLDVLVNNAGRLVTSGPFQESTPDGWLRQLDVSLLGVVRCIQQSLNDVLSSQGNVVTIGSLFGLTSLGDMEYGASKAAVHNLSRALAWRYGAQGLRFNAVAPGPVLTWRLAQADHTTRARLDALSPLGRIGRPADVAAAVAFLASEDAAWITGVTLPVDGGITTGPADLR